VCWRCGRGLRGPRPRVATGALVVALAVLAGGAAGVAVVTFMGGARLPVGDTSPTSASPTSAATTEWPSSSAPVAVGSPTATLRALANVPGLPEFVAREGGANERAADLRDQVRTAADERNFVRLKILTQAWVEFASGETAWLADRPPLDGCYSELHVTLLSAYAQMANGMSVVHEAAVELDVRLVEDGMTTFERGWQRLAGTEYQLEAVAVACSIPSVAALPTTRPAPIDGASSLPPDCGRAAFIDQTTDLDGDGSPDSVLFGDCGWDELSDAMVVYGPVVSLSQTGLVLTPPQPRVLHEGPAVGVVALRVGAAPVLATVGRGGGSAALMEISVYAIDPRFGGFQLEWQGAGWDACTDAVALNDPTQATIAFSVPDLVSFSGSQADRCETGTSKWHTFRWVVADLPVFGEPWPSPTESVSRTPPS
jgi:hypothetical protein